MRSKKVKRKKEFQEGSQERPVWNECMQQAHQKAPYRAKVQKFEQGSTIWPGVHNPARQGCRDVEKARARTGREQAGKERKGLKVRTRERHQAVEGETRPRICMRRREARDARGEGGAGDVGRVPGSRWSRSRARSSWRGLSETAKSHFSHFKQSAKWQIPAKAN